MLGHIRNTLRLQKVFNQTRIFSSRCYCSTGSVDGGDQDDKPKPKRRAARPSAVGEYKSAWYILSEEFKNAFTRSEDERVDPLPIPRETDILVIGGGAIGSSVAYWLKQRNPEGFQLAVVERDPTYTRAATVLSVGGVRQQFSLKENIEMSMFGADFIRNIKEHLSVYGVDPPDVQFNPQGYLFLATEDGAETLHANYKIQTELGARVQLMTTADLRDKFPWLNTEGIVCGSYGLENEGWFDPWLMLYAFRAKATSLGAEYVKGEVVGFKTDEQMMMGPSGNVIRRKRLNTAMIKHDNGETYPMNFACAVNCAGPWSGKIAQMAGIGVGEGALNVPLPVEPRKRYVFVVHCPDGPGLETPMVIDPTGVYVRREGLGGHYVCGASPSEDQEEYHRDGAEDKYYKDIVFPVLSHRVPALQTAKLKSAWAGFYDYNSFDQNLVIGNHPHHLNLLFATGCSGHGIQQAPAIGRAIMELIIDEDFQTINLQRFSFDRVLDNEPIYESNIV